MKDGAWRRIAYPSKLAVKIQGTDGSCLLYLQDGGRHDRKTVMGQ